MPNRIIKESILTSPTFAPLDAEEERHFYRLLLLSDDYGCLECTPRVLRGRCYSLLDAITHKDVAKWNDRLEEVGIIQRWTENEREYAFFLTFDKHNAKYSVTDDGKSTRHRRKTPPPPDEIIAKLGQASSGAATEPKNSPKPKPKPNPNPKQNPVDKNVCLQRKDAELMAVGMEQRLSDMAGRGVDLSRNRGFYTWAFMKMRESLIEEAYAATRDACDRSNDPCRDIPAYFAGALKTIARRNGIELEKIGGGSDDWPTHD